MALLKNSLAVGMFAIALVISGDLFKPVTGQALFATSPLFVLPIAARLGEQISFRAVMGVLVALAGVALLCLPP